MCGSVVAVSFTQHLCVLQVTPVQRAAQNGREVAIKI